VTKRKKRQKYPLSKKGKKKIEIGLAVNLELSGEKRNAQSVPIHDEKREKIAARGPRQDSDLRRALKKSWGIRLRWPESVSSWGRRVKHCLSL